MAIDQRFGTKVQKNLRGDSAPATRIDPYPLIGIVKNNFDSTRTGRLQVWIPEFSGAENDPKSWQTVSYSSPFMGTTNIANSTGGTASKANEFTNVPHTYGMWMIPPDIGVEVICIFINGDPSRGYWIGCINSNQSRHMMPGLAASDQVDTRLASNESSETYQRGQCVPVAEYNEFVDNTRIRTAKPIHEYQYAVLKNQGLDNDTVRGAISSSSQREAPSNVFGISTPGRPYSKDPADNLTQYRDKLNNETLTAEDVTYKTRRGGHTFVLDDGSVTGADQLIRLRTSQGHQLLMHDTAKSIYISHADGTSWVELTNDGRVKLYAQGGIDLRTKGTMNIHADRDINIDAAGKLNIKTGSGIKIDAGAGIDFLAAGAIKAQSTRSTVELKSAGQLLIDSGGKVSIQGSNEIAMAASTIKQNSGGTVAVKNIKPLERKSYSDSSKTVSGIYRAIPNLLQSITSSAPPTHEPYARTEANNRVDLPGITKNTSTQQPATSATAATSSPETRTVTPLLTPAAYSDNIDQTKNLAGVQIKNRATDKDLRNQPVASFTVGKLTTDQMTAYLAQMGRSESSSNYSAVNSIGYIGKYQFGYQALQDLGYVKNIGKFDNALLTEDYVWTGKNGVNSYTEFISSPEIQESVMVEYTKTNYDRLVSNKGITGEMSAGEVAGMLSAAHLLGAASAKQWRAGSGEPDAFGTTGDEYFPRGKYAVEVLALKMPAINAG